jgi:glyoxylase-like metal-dependent hydrolase (beta-lactamase superfamily II)
MLQPIDLNFLDTPETIAVFLLPIPDGYALFETGPHSTYDHLQQALSERGISVSEIRYVFLTHIHLDHAGAAWALAKEGAQVYVHPRGYPHLLDPSRLYASAKRIYQDDMDRLWGDFRPIPEEQLHEVQDGDQFQLGGHLVTAHFTPGHAVHHIAWQVDRALVAGDVAGVKIQEGPVMPPCPPPDINLEHWKESIDRILELDLDHLWLTHFGKVTAIDSHLTALWDRLQAWAHWIRPWFEEQVPAEEIVPKFQEFVQQDLLANGVQPDELDKYEKANPSWMSVAGLLRYWYKKTKA